MMRSQQREFRKALLKELIWIWSGLYVLAVIAAAPLVFAGPKRRVSHHSPTGSQLRNFKTAIELYRLDHHGKPPKSLQHLLAPPHGKGHEGWNGPYLQDVTSIPSDPWGHPYVYEVPGPEGETFRLTSYGQDGRPEGTGDAEDLSVSVP